MADGSALEVLSRVFGYDQFRGPQQEIVEHVIGGGDALVLMPTGAGKSLCYQVPALVRSGTGVVVSPLIALMQDQVDALTELGVRAAFLNSTQDFARVREVERAFVDGELDLLYVAPERLLTDRCLQLLERGRIAPAQRGVRRQVFIQRHAQGLRVQGHGLVAVADQRGHRGWGACRRGRRRGWRRWVRRSVWVRWPARAPSRLPGRPPA